MEKVALCMLAVFAVGHSLLVEDFYPFDRENDNLVPKGDSESSPQQKLSMPIVFYDQKYDSVTVSILIRISLLYMLNVIWYFQCSAKVKGFDLAYLLRNK